MSRRNKSPENTGTSVDSNSSPTYPPSLAEKREANKAVIAQIRDESESWWAWATAAWLLTLSFPLLLFPRFLLFLSTPSRAPGISVRENLTSLESYLCTHVGIGLIAIAIAVVISIPSAPPISRTVSEPTSQHPLLVPLSSSFVITAFVSYNTVTVGPLAMIMTLGCGFTGLWGLWVIAFQGTGNYSNKTGADKHTSAFLFGNKASASQQKKLWKQERDREIELQQMGGSAK